MSTRGLTALVAVILTAMLLACDPASTGTEPTPEVAALLDRASTVLTAEPTPEVAALPDGANTVLTAEPTPEARRLWLTGEIPPELGNLVNLRLADLKDADRTWYGDPRGAGEGPSTLAGPQRQPVDGEIPPELGQIVNLERLFLHENQLTGEIPPELGQIFNLEGLASTTTS